MALVWIDICPTCKGEMARGNKYCKNKCYENRDKQNE